MDWFQEEEESQSKQAAAAILLEDASWSFWDALIQQIKQDSKKIEQRYGEKIGTVTVQKVGSLQLKIIQNLTLPAHYLEVTFSRADSSIHVQREVVEQPGGGAFVTRNVYQFALTKEGQLVINVQNQTVDAWKLCEIILRPLLPAS